MSKEQTTKKKPSKKSPAAGKPVKLAAKHQKGTEVGAVVAQGAETAKGNGKPAHAAQARSAAPDPRLPAVGTTIEKRDRHGAVRCKCTVEEAGIRYAGKVYPSLSGAAMAAAKDLGLKNKTQNGYIWWGLIKPPRPGSHPVAAFQWAWERYRMRAEALVRDGVTDENREHVTSEIRKQAEMIASLEKSLGLAQK